MLIQTRNTSHYCWQYVQRGDYEGFYAAELARRRQYGYPPFVRLALLRISFPAEDPAGAAALGELARRRDVPLVMLQARARELGLRLLGPIPAPLAMLRGRRRFSCLIKSADWQSVRALYHEASRQQCARRLRLFLDLDPVNML